MLEQSSSASPSELTVSHDHERLLQGAPPEYLVTKTLQGNFQVDLYYENESQLGTITDPLYAWPLPFIMPWMVLVQTLLIAVIGMYFKMDDRIHIFLQTYVVVTFTAEYFFSDIWPTKGVSIAWLHMIGIPLISILIYLKRGTKSTYIMNFYKAVVYFCYFFCVLDYPASRYRMIKALSLFIVGVIGVIVLSMVMQKERRRQKELTCSLATSMLIFLLVRNLVEHYSGSQDSRNVLGTLFKTRHSMVVAINSRFYDSVAHEIKLYWVYIPPFVYIPAMLRYFLVMHRYSKENAMGFDSNPMLIGDASFEINTDK